MLVAVEGPTLDEDLQAISSFWEKKNQSSPGTISLIGFPLLSSQSFFLFYVQTFLIN